MLLRWTRKRSEIRWRPGQETKFRAPCLNLSSSGSKSTALKKVLATLLKLFGSPKWFGARCIVPPFPPRYAPGWTLDNAPLPLVIKPKVVKEALQWRFERRAQVLTYVNQTEMTSEINFQCNYFTLAERHFRSKNKWLG